MGAELFGLVFSVAFIAGVIGNLAASVIWASPAGVALARKLNRHHAEHLAQAERHHIEATAQRLAHHNEAKRQAAKHQQELLDRADVHHETLKQHVTAQSRPVSSVVVEPQQMAEVTKAAERTRRTPS